MRRLFTNNISTKTIKTITHECKCGILYSEHVVSEKYRAIMNLTTREARGLKTAGGNYDTARRQPISAQRGPTVNR